MQYKFLLFLSIIMFYVSYFAEQVEIKKCF